MNAQLTFQGRGQRAQKARLASVFTGTKSKILVAIIVIFGLLALLLWFAGGYERLVYLSAAFSLIGLMVLAWYKWDLSQLKPSDKPTSLDDIMEPSLLAKLSTLKELNPQTAWQAATGTWHGRFFCSHLLLPLDAFSKLFGDSASSMENVWNQAQDLMAKNQAQELNGSTLAAAAMLSAPSSKDILAKLNLKEEDVLETDEWLNRLNKFLNQPRPYFGGIGRDWAAGFTPTLDQFSQNISHSVERGQGHFHTLAHADVLDGVVHNLSQGSGSVALVGETGAGKTSLVYALAQRLLEGNDKELLYYQVFTLNASAILSSAGDRLERIMLTLFGEAVHAGNIILFLDDAHLFFSSGTGSMDLSQILQPVLQNRRVKIIAALTPHDYQSLKSENSALVSQIPSVTIPEPDANTVLKILEDTALTVEQRDRLLIPLQTLREAFKLSGQYEQELAYPGKAISLLEQSLAYVDDRVLTPESVQQAVEKTKGVKVSKAQAPEADKLLRLEELIHKRMINQEQAVKVVSAALRRGRAGVSNPNRPVGSFLFLGPTGVGKTELARSLAATYFGDERQMVRLDMSEYQRPEDVSRLLDSGTEKSGSLIMSIREQPFSVVLLDEIEKANPGVLNLLLQMLDEGQLTDQNGRPASFDSAIIITTSNAGSAEITQKVGAGDSLESFERPLIEKLINAGLFKPELINRFDEIVLFRPLNEQELVKVAKLMLNAVNKTLSNQNVTVELTDAALAQVVKAGYDPQFGARPMRRAIQTMVEDAIANRLLAGETKSGDKITLDVGDLT